MNEQAVSRTEFDELRHQVSENTRRLASGDTKMALLDQRLEQIDEKLGEVALGIKALQEKPAKRWDAITGQIVNWIVALLLGVLALKVGLN